MKFFLIDFLRLAGQPAKRHGRKLRLPKMLRTVAITRSELQDQWMLTQKELMAGKIAMLERVLKDVLINGFLTAADPAAAAEEYAEIRKMPRPDFIPDPRFEIARQEVWNAFLDDVVGGVKSRVNDRSK